MTIDRRSFLILLTLTACSSKGSSSSLKIGASLPLTGPAADVADPGYKGYQVWQSQINARGGLLGRQVEFVILDDGFDQNTVVSNYNRLITQDRVDLLIGTISSFLNLPASTVADRNRMLYIEPSGGAAEIFSRGHTRLFFSQPGTTDTAHRPFAAYIEGLSSKPATAAYLHQDDPSTDVPVQNLQKTFEALGIKTVYGQKYPPDTKNFDAIANAIRQANPALLVHGALEVDGASVVQALQRIGFTPSILYQTRAPSSVNTYPQAIGATNTEAIFTAGSWHPAAKYPGNAEFVADYRKQFKQEPSEDAANSYTAAQVLQAGVQAIGKLDQDAIAAWLHANTVDTVVGPLKWDKRGVPDGSLLLMQWQAGKLEVVAPSSAATVPSAIAAKPSWAT